MKKFFFSLLIGVLVSGLSYFALTRIDLFPEHISTLQAYHTKIHENYLKPIDHFFIGFNLTEPSITLVTLNGLYAFISLWVVLSLLLGIKGFFSDLFSFFPLRK